MKDDNEESGSSGMFDLNSKFWKTFLTIVAVILIFAGPTYLIYVLVNILKANYVVSIVSGFAIFAAGLVLMWYLVRKEIIA